MALGFGTSAAGVHDLTAAANPLATLADRFVGGAMGTALTAGVALSAFAGVLALPSAASRLLFAFARDGLMPAGLAVVTRNGSPVRSLLSVLSAAVLTVAAFAVAGISDENTFFYLGTIGTLLLLMAHALVNVGALRWRLSGRLGGARFLVVLPILALGVLGFALYSNIWPVPDPPFNLFPYLAVGWLILGAMIVLCRPAQARSAGERLIAAELGDISPDGTDQLVIPPEATTVAD